MSEVNPNTHVLLNQAEFADALFGIGYDRAMSRSIFNRVVRGAWDITPNRSPESICYSEFNPAGKRELVLSLPNMASHLPEISEIRQVGEFCMGAITELVAPYVQDASQESD
jgi:hypothetical protein